MIISITDQKGGVGKTTTTSAMLDGLTQRGYKVLAIDLDSQCNLTLHTGAKTEKTILSVLSGDIKAKESIQTTTLGDIIPASNMLATADNLFTDIGKEYLLREALKPLKSKYDFILLDTPPALNILTVNALTVSDYVVIPAVADLYSLQGIDQLRQTIDLVRSYTNPKIKVAGILLTMHNQRTKIKREVAEIIDQIAERLNTKVFTQTIRQSVKASEVQFKQQGLFTYCPNAPITQDYNNFINEFLERTSNNGK